MSLVAEAGCRRRTGHHHVLPRRCVGQIAWHCGASGESATIGREALTAEMDRRVAMEQPESWKDVVDLGFGVARAVLGDEPNLG